VCVALGGCTCVCVALGGCRCVCVCCPRWVYVCVLPWMGVRVCVCVCVEQVSPLLFERGWENINQLFWSNYVWNVSATALRGTIITCRVGWLLSAAPQPNSLQEKEMTRRDSLDWMFGLGTQMGRGSIEPSYMGLTCLCFPTASLWALANFNTIDHTIATPSSQTGIIA